MNIVTADAVAGQSFDLVIVGTGFGSAFYLHEALKHGLRRVLVVEWGDEHTHEWKLEHDKNSAIADEDTYRTNSEKEWNYTVAFGGGTNCWHAQTPRLHPTDFAIKSRYGVGEDWPITYDDLEPFYGEAEAIMSLSGDPDMASILPRSTPFPQPPHRMSSPDRLMKAAQPQHHFVMPTGRARIATEGRGACCASLRCELCPADAKFTAQNSLRHLYMGPSVSLCLKARASRFETRGGTLESLVFEQGGKEYRVRGERFVLGANAIQSPAILLRTGTDQPLTGAGLHESVGIGVEVYLDGVDNFDGSTLSTGLNYALYDGPFRKQTSGALIHFENRWTYGLRPDRGKTRQSLPLIVLAEDLPQPENRVVLGPDSSAFVEFRGASDYAKRGLDRAMDLLPQVLAPLPVEAIHLRNRRPTESHLQGTLRMGRDASNSVIDGHQVHHRWRNLTVVGSAVFPSCSCAPPSLTVAALSLRAARLAVDGV